MTLRIEVLTCGQLGNNVSVLFDPETRAAAVFDPSYQPERVMSLIIAEKLNVEKIFLTHGHFDHFAGVNYLMESLPVQPRLGMHRDDLALLKDGGGSKHFHFPVESSRDPDFFVEDGQILKFGDHDIEVRLAPGHTAGSVIYCIPALNCAVCGDVIFYHSVGRTDLPGGNFDILLNSIQRQIFSLPADMRLIPGHGEVTYVGEERVNNPFINS